MPVNRFGQALPAYDSSASIGGDPVKTTDLVGDQSALNPSGVPDGYVPVSQGDGSWAWEAQSGTSGGGTDPGALRAANNLSDLGNVVTARTNLGLGTAATSPIAAFEPAGAVAAAIAGLGSIVDWKASVRVATTANITLSGTQTIDGVALIAGNRVLVKDQSSGAANGIYVVAAGTWTRAVDADALAEVTPGLTVAVEEGSTNGAKLFMLVTPAPITLDTTALSFQAVSGSGGTLTTEQVQDIVGAFVQPGDSYIDVVYDDASNALVLSANSTNLAELIRDTIAATLVQGSNVTITNNDGANTITIAASGSGGGGGSSVQVLGVALTSDTTAPPAASAIVAVGYLRVPYACTLVDLRAFQLEPDDTTATIVDCHVGTATVNATVLDTRITIPANQWSSLAGPPIDFAGTSTSISLPDDSELRFYLDQRGAACRGVKAYAYVVPTSVATATAPGAPTGLTVTPGNAQNVLAWSAPGSTGTVSGGAAATITAYVIEWGTDGVTFPNTITDDATAGYTHTGRTNGTTYHYRVKATNSAALTGNASSSASGIPSGGGSAPAAPTLAAEGVGATFFMDNYIQLQWNTVATATSYDVQARVTAGAGAWQEATETEFTPTGSGGGNEVRGGDVNVVFPTMAISNTNYDFRVRAVNGSGQSAWSNIVVLNNASGG
jgi:hypothetical protein